MNQWYVVYTQPSKESFAYDNLCAQDYEVFYPVFMKKTSHARKIQFVKAPLFPRYMFVNFDKQACAWRAINGTKGVVSLLSFGEQLGVVPTSLVNQLRGHSDINGFIDLMDIESFQPNDQVEIIDGPFKGHLGKFLSKPDSDRVQILIDFMQREMSVCVHKSAVKAA